MVENDIRRISREIVGTGPEMVLVAGNRGTCGGVNMALEAVDIVMSMVPTDRSVYVSHSPVNYRPAFERYGERLVNVRGDISAVPDRGDFIVSAHGAPPEVFEEAVRRGITLIDTTCAIVTDEHRQIRKVVADGGHAVFIGEEDHPETVGVRGQVKESEITILDPRKLPLTVVIPDGSTIFSKTTNTPDDVAEAIELITHANPTVDTSRAHQCYATHNRQVAARAMINNVNLWLVVGDTISHNTRQLQRIGVDSKVPSMMIADANEVDLSLFKDVKSLGVTSGASVPERFTQEVLEVFRRSGVSVVELEQAVREADRTFKLPAFDELSTKYNLN